MAVRKLGAGVLTATLFTGVVVALSAAPAAASSEDITSPENQAVITDRSSVLITAEPDLLKKGALRLRGPNDDSYSKVDEGYEKLRYRLDVSCPDYKGPCEHPAPNGPYMIHLESAMLVLAQEQKQKFVLRVPPAQPSDLSAEPVNSSAVRLLWDRGEEPDLETYEVLASGNVVESVSAENVCGGASCETVVSLGSDTAGERVALAIRARRHTAPGSERTIASAASEGVVVRLPGSTATLSATMFGSGKTGSLARGSGTGSQSAQRPDLADAPTGSQRALPSLQPLSSGSQLFLPDVAKKSGESIERRHRQPMPVLPSSTPQPIPRGGDAAVEEPGDAAADVGAAPRSMTATAMTPSQWWKTVALGLVLLLVAAHLGAWTWRTRPVPARTGARRGGGRVPKPPANALAVEESRHNAEEPGVRVGSDHRGRRRA